MEIRLFDAEGDWGNQRLIFTQLVLIPMPVQRRIKIDLVLRNRVVEPYNLNFLVEDGAGVLPCLRTLDMSGLGFSEFGIEENDLLKELRLLVSMASSLEILDLGDSIIDSHMLDILAQGLNAHQALRVLCLQKNLLCDDTVADGLLDALNSSMSIQHIKLGQNKIHKRHPIWMDSRVSNS
jgi:hypothetical protein